MLLVRGSRLMVASVRYGDMTTGRNTSARVSPCSREAKALRAVTARVTSVRCPVGVIIGTTAPSASTRVTSTLSARETVAAPAVG
jgi:hypothetical protein